MAQLTRAATLLASASLLLGVSPALAAQPDPDVVAQKQSVLTPSLQRLAADEPPGVQAAEILTRPNGRIVVDVRLSDTSARTLDDLRQAGARMRFLDTTMQVATVAIDAADLPALASVTGIISVREVLRPMTNAACPSGPFVSEGVTQLRAALARTQFSVTGRGVTVGVLSDTYNQLGGAAADVSNGELPGAGNPCGHTTAVGNLEEGPVDGGDEGRAMAQIIHDVAPDAKILFASAFNGEGAFAQSIRNLAAAGADIIVDDITYYDEPMFQDGVVAKAVDDVTAQGVAYFSSAANSNLNIGMNRVASYEAPSFRSTACPAAISAHYLVPVTCHDFDPGAGTDALYGFAYDGELTYSLGWSEPQNGITTDLDFCLMNSTGTTISGCGEDPSIATGMAFEFLNFTGAGPRNLVVVRYAGAGTPRLKFISHRSDLTSVDYATTSGGDIVGPTIFGHNASIPGVTVGAVPYTNSSTLEWFSSWGPAKYCWQPVTGPTPSPALTPCQTATVDMSATDGGQNSFFGGGNPNRFYGTSAAAPHAAAVAALVLDREQCLTQAQITAALQASGRAVGATGIDGAGAGLIDAVPALTAVGGANCDTAPPLIDLGRTPGWYRTDTAIVTAADHRTVAALSCTGATLQGVTGIGTPEARGTWSVAGEGRHTVACSGTDAEGNSGGPSVTFNVDTTPPVTTCRPAKLKWRKPGSVTATVTDALSGPASPTATAAVPTSKAGSFGVTLTGADVAGNTESAMCAYSVAPLLKAPARAKAGAKPTFKAAGLPGKAKVKWTVKHNGKTIQTKRGKASKAGVAKVKVALAKAGNYTVSIRVAGTSASKTIRVS